MVRHECAEALGAVATQTCLKTLEKYLSDEDPVVCESCEVALDMAEYEMSGDFCKHKMILIHVSSRMCSYTNIFMHYFIFIN